jgi:hypothetical protein
MRNSPVFTTCALEAISDHTEIGALPQSHLLPDSPLTVGECKLTSRHWGELLSLT